ncbi:uncharacterized protein LOC144990926 isoform X4 [Oryzias latipes]
MCAGSTFSHRSRLSPAAAAGVAHRHRPVRSVDTREPAVSTTKRTSRGEIPPVFGAPMGPGESSGGHMMPGGSMGSQFIGQQSYGDAVSKGYGQPVMYGRPGAAYNPGSAYGGRRRRLLTKTCVKLEVFGRMVKGQRLEKEEYTTFDFNGHLSHLMPVQRAKKGKEKNQYIAIKHKVSLC